MKKFSKEYYQDLMDEYKDLLLKDALHKLDKRISNVEHFFTTFTGVPSQSIQFRDSVFRLAKLYRERDERECEIECRKDERAHCLRGIGSRLEG